MAEPAGHIEVHHAEQAEVQHAEHAGHVEAQPAQKVEVQHTEKVEVQGTVTGGSCCPPGSEGKLKAAYTPRGTNSTLGDLPIYTVGKGNKAIIFSYDVFGVTSGRTVELCDQFADAGFLVILPDFIRGDTYFSDTDFSKIGEWFAKYPWDKINADLTTHVYPYLESKAVKSIGMVGCCWGAATVYRASGDNKTIKRSGGCFGAPKTIVTPRLSAGVSFHPTLSADLVEEVGGKINCPQLVLPAGNDPDVLKTGGQLEKILKEKLGADKVTFQDFPDMAHGWVPRGDISKPEVARDVKAAMDLATAFFKKHL